ncbi:hypothetical protein Krad_4548 (plasmid) [Kineococcus radiotolerans SRS30216 = ATCC BAA-149]|uniref:Uncharacterized protein n=1 Tax=Kineococcus radiotolerans (strain ATCC BAA-149 / DSM 14245 / SRS30216) TaxID=266940 RepID=A6WGR8_KINRD|nr:hypothetical protein Krad_4548 [Kineococcus radiotolerans SRS30216 = ATCC BAA-149]
MRVFAAAEPDEKFVHQAGAQLPPRYPPSFGTLITDEFIPDAPAGAARPVSPSPPRTSSIPAPPLTPPTAPSAPPNGSTSPGTLEPHQPTPRVSPSPWREIRERRPCRPLQAIQVATFHGIHPHPQGPRDRLPRHQLFPLTMNPPLQ